MSEESTFNTCNILIVDDDASFLQVLEMLLNEIGIKNIFAAENIKDALLLFDSNRIDVCLLDIDLGIPNRSGIDLAEMIRMKNRLMPIVFITSNYTQDYYQAARHVSPTGFMSKEFSRFKLIQAVDLALLNTRNWKKASNQVVPSSSAIPYISDEQAFFKIGDSYKGVKLKNIAYFFAKDGLTFARVKERNYPTSVQLKTLGQELFPQFIRIHRAYLINKRCIQAIHPKDGKIEVEGELLPIGHVYRKVLFEQINILK